MTDGALKGLYESVLGVTLLPHQLQTLKQLRFDESKNKKDEMNAHEPDDKRDSTRMYIIYLYFAGTKEQSGC